MDGTPARYFSRGRAERMSVDGLQATLVAGMFTLRRRGDSKESLTGKTLGGCDYVRWQMPGLYTHRQEGKGKQKSYR